VTVADQLDRYAVDDVDGNGEADSGILLWRTIHSSLDVLSELECCNLMVIVAKTPVTTASKIERFILSIFVGPAAICAKQPAKR
jgi:hypothetical protein